MEVKLMELMQNPASTAYLIGIYVFLYIVEFSFMVWAVRKIMNDKSYCLNELTVADLTTILLIPATIIILPIVLIIPYISKLSSLVIWRRK